MGILSWIVLGAIAGFLANMVVGGREGVIGTIILGIIWAVVGGYLAQAVLHKGDVTGVNIESIVIAVVGAIIVLFVWRALRGEQTLLIGQSRPLLDRPLWGGSGRYPRRNG